MQSGKRGCAVGGAVWLGLLALALNALVPVHIAFDLAEALAPAHHRTALPGDDDAEHHLLALLTGHRDADHESHHHGKSHGAACPVCSALGALAGFAAPAPPVLALPAPVGLPAPLPLPEIRAVGTPAAYRSRAPPTV